MEPMEHMRQALSRFVALPASQWEEVAASYTQRSLPKGAFLTEAGQVERHIYFLHKGAVRNYFIKDGKEFTVAFHFEGEFVSAYYSFLTRRPSEITMEALEDIVVCGIHQDDLYRFYAASAYGERIGRLIAEHQYTRRLEREMELLSLTAEERYHRLVERHPALVRQISVKHLSSYLGIQPESLSRIRRQFPKN
ncbi:Crp/Fnr family transcriptional regulator [Chitinophaga lutea]